MKKRFLFNSASFVETTQALHGPARGWYHLYVFHVDQAPALEDLDWGLNEETCVRVVLDIGAYRGRHLSDDALDNIHRILSFFDQRKKDILLRVAYDTKGKCLEREPTLFSLIAGHIRQLGPVIMAFSQRILLYEGMLVGNWGEMHGSRFLTKKYMCQLNDALAQSLPGVIRAVRRPAQWRMLHPSPPGPGTMVGLFNDAIFGSATDLGTFAPARTTDMSWEALWSPEREILFERQLSAFVPQCGEAVLGEDYARHTLSSTVERLWEMGMTWLNSVYDDNILRLWREWTWEGPDPWRGMNGFDYIGRHLGYRFCVRSAVARGVGPDVCELTLTVENTGFSGFYQEAEVFLILTEENGQESFVLTDWDIRGWKNAVSLTGRVPCREGKLWLYARRKWDHATIPFANDSTPQGWVFLGELKK